MSLNILSLNSYFKENGYLVFEEPQTKQLAFNLKKAIVDVMIERSKTLDLKINEKDDIDQIYQKLFEFDPAVTGGIYDVIRELPEYLEMINNVSLKSLVKEMFGWEKVHIPFGLCQFRIDRPSDKKYHFDWHQDYTYNIISQSAVTFWVPLTDVTLETGAIKILPQSHHNIHPVKGKTSYAPGEKGDASSHLTYQLDNPDLDTFESKSISVPIKAGNILVFNSLVLHRSGKNVSKNLNRWVSIFRMGDLYDKNLVTRNFFCSRPNKPNTMAGFSKIHPEFFSDL
jgi:phytanoyl-CoA hydroxylase